MSFTSGLSDRSSTTTAPDNSGFFDGPPCCRLALGSRWPYELADERDETVENVEDRFEYSDEEEGEVMLKGSESGPVEDLGVLAAEEEVVV